MKNNDKKNQNEKKLKKNANAPEVDVETLEEVKQETKEKAEDEKENKKEVSEENTEKNEVNEIKKELEKVKKERDEFKNKYIRLYAEFENFRKRSFSEKADWIKNANERLILELCEVNDNFQRALENGIKEHQFESFKKGVELIYQQIGNILKKESVEKIEALEKEFDPNFHEALAHIPSELEKNKVTAIIQNGYKMNDKIIRTAKVAVSNGEKIVNQENTKKENNTQK